MGGIPSSVCMGHLGDGTESTGLGVDFPTPAGMDGPETAEI